MSDEDSLSEMNVAPARLMPKSPSITEHHRVLNLSAIHSGNTIATLKAHHVRQNNLEERVEDLEGVKEAVWEIKTKIDSWEKALCSQGDAIGTLSTKIAEQSTSSEIKKAVVTGIFTLLISIVAAYTGYVQGHSPTPDTPYREQVHQIAPASAASSFHP